MSIAEPYLKAIGRVTVNFSDLELLLSQLLWILTTDQDAAIILTSHLSFQRLCHALGAIIKAKLTLDASTEREAETIIREATRLEQERNRLIHSIWGRSPDEAAASRLKVTARQELKVQFDPIVPLKQLEQVANEIEALSARVVWFSLHHGLRLDPEKSAGDG